MRLSSIDVTVKSPEHQTHNNSIQEMLQKRTKTANGLQNDQQKKITCLVFLFGFNGLFGVPRLQRFVHSRCGWFIDLTLHDVPFNSNSPRVLNVENWNRWALHSFSTSFSLASISRSFTAEMQTSWTTTPAIPTHYINDIYAHEHESSVYEQSVQEHTQK